MCEPDYMFDAIAAELRLRQLQADEAAHAHDRDRRCDAHKAIDRTLVYVEKYAARHGAVGMALVLDTLIRAAEHEKRSEAIVATLVRLRALAQGTDAPR